MKSAAPKDMTDTLPRTTAEPRSASAPRASPLPGLCLALALTLAVAIRWRLHALPLERDEGEYAYMGQLLLGGGMPYRDAYNMKFPGTYAAYALAMAAFGQTPAGIRTGLILVNLATSGFVFGLTRKLFSQAAAIYAAALFLLLSLCPGMLAIMAHATHFVIFFSTLGLWILVCAVEPRRLRLLFLSGVMLGAAVLMKQQGGFFVLFAMAYVAYQSRGAGWAQPALAVLGGAGLPVAACFLWIAETGAWSPFWFWTVTYASRYAGIESWRDGFAILLNTVLGFWPFALPLLLGVAGLVYILIRERHRAFVLGAALASCLAICPGLYFRSHYFIMALPVLAVAGGVLLKGADDRIAHFNPGARLAGAAGILAVLLSPIVVQRNLLLILPLDEVMSRIYGPETFVPAAAIGEYIRDHSSPEDRIAVFGSEPEIYFYAHRRAATGYIYTYSLMEPQPFAARMQSQMEGEIERASPMFLVDVEDTYSWLPWPGSDQTVFQWFNGYVKGFHAVGVVTLAPKPVITWNPDAHMALPESQLVIIYERNVPAASSGRPARSGPTGPSAA